MTSPKITVRTPTTSTTSTSQPTTTFIPPPLPFLLGTWNVTHSTLSMWKRARNVQISYALPQGTTPETALPTQKLDDTVTYQSLDSANSKKKSILGIDSPAGPGAWNWRGKGWLVIVGSHWEVLGYGGDKKEGDEEEEWCITYFASTMFTSAGLDFYSRGKKALSLELVEGLKKALKELGDGAVSGLVDELFEVKID